MTGLTGSKEMARPIRLSDVMLTCVALAIGLPSFTYPLGHDQSVHWYVAREWLERGALPYRDVFDHKTPGIYLVHALSMRMFGVHPWAIRPIELASVVALGWAIGALTERAWYGAGALVVSFVYYGFFPYLDTAQPDLWATVLAVFAIVAAGPIPRPGRSTSLCLPHEASAPRSSPALAGLLAGAALVMKPPAAPLVLLALRRGGLVRFLAGAAVIPAAFALYFAAHGALPAMCEVLVKANAAYVAYGRAVRSVSKFVDVSGDLFGWFHPVSSTLLTGAVVRLVCRRGALEDWGFPVVTLAAGFAAVLVQMKFTVYHATPLVPGLALIVLRAAEELMSAARRPHAAAMAISVVTVLTYPLAGRRARAWWSAAREVASFAPDHQTVASREYAESRVVAAWIHEHSRPEDAIVVRGLHAEVYVLADRRYGGRFFWSAAYTTIMKDYGGAVVWRAEDERTFDALKPRYVASADVPPLDFGGDGYVLEHRIGAWTVWGKAQEL